MIRLFLEILKDERGIAPMVAAGLGTMAASALGGLFGKDKEKTEVYDPYAKLRQQYQDYLGGKLGTSRPYSYNAAFETQQPEVEAETEKGILGKLRSPYSAAEAKEQVEASKTQQISREKERAAEQQKEEQNMYNRLGLVSSTPWMTRAGELGEESLGRQRDIETSMDIYGLDYGLQADKLAEDIENQYLTQGQVLGSRQRGYQQSAQQMSMEDILRQIQEEQGYGSMTSSLIGQPTTVVSSQPSTARQLGETGMDIGTLMMLMGMGG